jgi:hypothetical protein
VATKPKPRRIYMIYRTYRMYMYIFCLFNDLIHAPWHVLASSGLRRRVSAMGTPLVQLSHPALGCGERERRAESGTA